MNDDVATIRVLHVDDEPTWRDLVAEMLERQHGAITVRTAPRARDALDRLGERRVDCILSDYEMPGMDGLEFLRAVRADHPDLPFVLFTGRGSEELASDAISAGVTEYLQKESTTEQYTLLANRIERAVTERRARDALEESERMLSTLIGNLPGMVYRCENERGWPMLFVSRGCEALTGYRPETLESGDVSWGADVVHPDDSETMWERVQTAVDAGEPFQVTYRIRRRDGALRWLWERGSGVREAGDVVALEGFITDITPRKRREQELRAEREFTQSALNALEDVFFVVDADRQRFLRWNDRLSERTGYDDDRLSGMRPSDLVAEADVDRVERAMERALDERDVTVTADVVTSGGECVPVEFRGSPLRDDEGGLIGIGAVGRDISDRRERERELERFETVVQAVGDPVYALDADGRFRFVNDAFEAMTGYRAEEVVGEHVGTVITDESVRRGREHISGLLDGGGRAVKFEVEVTPRSGERIPSELHVALLPTDDGSFRGTAGIIRDIEARKQRERRLEEFASVVSHDLRGPLNVILGQAQLAMEDPGAADVGQIVESGQRMEALIGDLLTLARQGETVGERTATDLSSVVESAWAATETAGNSLDNRAEGAVRADAERLQELVENLLRNAVEHAGPGATVTVGRLEDGPGFFVADDGPGIPPAERDAVLERGYTTRDGGTGFGLAIVERIAAAHGWSLSVTGSEDGGARFEFVTG